MKKIVSIALLLIGTLSIQAQSVNLAYGSSKVAGIPDTTEFSKRFNASFYLVNVGSDTIFDQVEIRYSVDDQKNMWNYKVVAVSPPDHDWYPGDSVYFEFKDSIVSPTYRTGDNIIVIWPSSTVSTGGTLETYETNTIVFDSNNSVSLIEESSLGLFLYPNPVVDRMKVNCACDFTWELFDANGRFVKDGTDGNIDVSELSTGNYFIHVIHQPSKQRFVKTFMKD